MSLIKDEFRCEIDGREVAVVGTTGPVNATWTLLVDDVEVDQARATGDFTLRAPLDAADEVTALVHQSMIGPTEVAILYNGEEHLRDKGFVA